MAGSLSPLCLPRALQGKVMLVLGVSERSSRLGSRQIRTPGLSGLCVVVHSGKVSSLDGFYQFSNLSPSRCCLRRTYLRWPLTWPRASTWTVMGWPRSSCSMGTISTARATMMGLFSSISGQSWGALGYSSACSQIG